MPHPAHPAHASALHIEQRRGGLLETVHPISARVVRDGKVTFEVGPDMASFWRSASKPVQLTTSLLHLPDAQVDGLTEEQLSIGASSHSGQPLHVAHVGRLLADFGLTPDGLRCGAHAPMHEPSARDLLRAGERWTVLHNNCSGKHTFMLAAAAAQGWDADYLPIAHPLQASNLARLSAWMECRPEVAVDGCGVPTFHAPLSAMARCWSVLAAETRRCDAGHAAPSREAELVGRIGRAMRLHPVHMSGDGRLDLAVVRGATRPLTVKVGAEGLFCIADAESGSGVAVKVHTGNADALAVGVAAVLERVWPGALAPTDWPWARVKNVAGAQVGERLAVWA